MSTSKILITGSSGLIGSALYSSLKNLGFLVHGIDILSGSTVDSILDISLRYQLGKKLDEYRPDIIIHAAAIKGLTKCENEKTKCWAVNVESTSEIAEYAKRHGSKVVFISSDVVFDGKVGDYREGDLPNPINWYGNTKYQSELLLKNIPKSAICRTAFVFGDPRKEYKDELAKELRSGVLNNQSLFPYYVIDSLKNGKIISLPDKIISSPTPVSLLETAIKIIITRDLSGIYHCTGSEPISRYRLATKIAQFFGLQQSLIKIDESNVSDIRPKNLGMNVTRTYRDLGLNKEDWNASSILGYINNLSS